MIPLPTIPIKYANQVFFNIDEQSFKKENTEYKLLKATKKAIKIRFTQERRKLRNFNFSFAHFYPLSQSQDTMFRAPSLSLIKKTHIYINLDHKLSIGIMKLARKNLDTAVVFLARAYYREFGPPTTEKNHAISVIPKEFV